MTLDELKAQWLRDPSFDLEDTPGFEAHRDELLEFKRRVEAERQRAAQHEELKRQQRALGVFDFPVEVKTISGVSGLDADKYADMLNSGWAVQYQQWDSGMLRVIFIRPKLATDLERQQPPDDTPVKTAAQPEPEKAQQTEPSTNSSPSQALLENNALPASSRVISGEDLQRDGDVYRYGKVTIRANKPRPRPSFRETMQGLLKDVIEDDPTLIDDLVAMNEVGPEAYADALFEERLQRIKAEHLEKLRVRLENSPLRRARKEFEDGRKTTSSD